MKSSPCLDSGEDSNFDNILNTAAPAQVMHWLFQSLDHRAYDLGISKPLSNLVANVACIEVWEDEHIGITFGEGIFVFCLIDDRDNSSIKLDLAINNQVFSLLFHNPVDKISF